MKFVALLCVSVPLAAACWLPTATAQQSEWRTDYAAALAEAKAAGKPLFAVIR